MGRIIDANEKREEIIREAEEELKNKEITQEYNDNVIDLDSFY